MGIFIESSQIQRGFCTQILGAGGNPQTGDGDLGKMPVQKSEFCAYLFLVLGTNSAEVKLDGGLILGRI